MMLVMLHATLAYVPHHRPALLSAQPNLRAPMFTFNMAAKKSKSRFGDDGTRETGVTLFDDSGLSKGLFSNFKWGTEVEVGEKKKDESGKKGARGMAGDNSDRGLSGNQSYRNTETARFMGGDPGQEIRKQKLEAYINSDAPAADKTFGKIIAGSLILTLIALLGGVVAYYGIDGLIAAR